MLKFASFYKNCTYAVLIASGSWGRLTHDNIYDVPKLNIPIDHFNIPSNRAIPAAISASNARNCAKISPGGWCCTTSCTTSL